MPLPLDSRLLLLILELIFLCIEYFNVRYFIDKKHVCVFVENLNYSS